LAQLPEHAPRPLHGVGAPSWRWPSRKPTEDGRRENRGRENGHRAPSLLCRAAPCAVDSRV